MLEIALMIAERQFDDSDSPKPRLLGYLVPKRPRLRLNLSLGDRIPLMMFCQYQCRKQATSHPFGMQIFLWE